MIREFATGATRDTEEGKHDPEGFLSSEVVQRVEKWEDTREELAWAGGLFEGEGCIMKKNDNLSLQIRMCDQDALLRFKMIVGFGNVTGPYKTRKTGDQSNSAKWRPNYVWQVYGQNAIKVASLLTPYLGARRLEKLQSILVNIPIDTPPISALSPVAIQSFNRYMHKHRIQADGTIRESGNWKKGMPISVFMKSLWRHLLDVWLHHEGRGEEAREPIEDALCAIIFNAQGFLHELLKAKMVNRDNPSK